MTVVPLLLSAALAGAASLGLALLWSAFPRIRLSTRRGLLVAGLFAAALAPVVVLATHALGLGLLPQSVLEAVRGGEGRSTNAAPLARHAAATGAAAQGHGAAAPLVPAIEVAGAPTLVAAGAARSRSLVAWPEIVVGLWLVGIILGGLRIGAGLVGVARIRRSLRRTNDPRLAGVWVSDALTGPATVGLLRPVVVVPEALAGSLSDEELAAVLRHEASHVARRDPLVGLLARTARALHWPNPLVHLAARRLDAACEALADAEAVAPHPAQARRYASCLLRIAESMRGARSPVGVHGITARLPALTRRIHALIERPVGDPRPSRVGRWATGALGGVAVLLAACCCPKGDAPRTQPSGTRVWSSPSPSNAPILALDRTNDPSASLPRHTFTDGMLQWSEDPRLRGTIAVFLPAGTTMDRRSLYLQGDPALGLNPSALQILRYVVGTGSVPLAGRAEVDGNVIRFTPQSLPLPDGQYSIGVYPHLKRVDGTPVVESPNFHSFTVGVPDRVPPEVVTTRPVHNDRDAVAGLPTGEVIVWFSEAIDPRSVGPETLRAVDTSAFVGGDYPHAPPTVPGDALVDLDTGGFSIRWRAHSEVGGLPYGAKIRVTVVGADGEVARETIRDLAGNRLAHSFTFEFTTKNPPSLPPEGRREDGGHQFGR